MLKTPQFFIEQNGNPVPWQDDVESVNITDGIGEFVDTAEITLRNRMLPVRGEVVSIRMGYVDDAWDMGRYRVSIITSGNEPKAVIKCQGIAFNEPIKSKHNQAYRNLTVQEIVAEIAERNKLKSRCDIAHRYDYLGQDNQSDIELLKNLAADHNALFNIKSDRIVLLDKNADTLPHVTISTTECTYSISETSKGFYPSVEVSWQNTKTNAIERVRYGSGTPTLNIQRQFSSISEAKIYAENQYKSHLAQTRTGKLITHGMPIFAGYVIDLVNAGVHSGNYLIEQAEHRLGKKYELTLKLQEI